MNCKRLSRTFFNRPTLRVARELLGKFLVRRIGQKTMSATCPAQNREGVQRDIVLCGMITETEAYCGPNDLASHASRGCTPRTEVMFGPPGHAYVYMIYGMYHCLNVVTEKEGYPAAVLIRAVSIERLGFSKNKTLPESLHEPLNAKRYTLNPILNGPALTPERAEASKKPGGEATTTRLVSGPGKLCRHFQIDRSLNREDLITSKNLWFEDRGIKVKPSQIERAPRIGVNYAGEYKDKPWRFFVKN